MPFRKEHQQGVTLLEIILVLAIMMMILYLSIRQYQIYRRDADIQQLKYNVDVLFQAVSQYYRANCNKPPLNSYYQGQSYSVSIQTLTDQGFLTTTLPMSPFVAYPPHGVGFIVQLNQYQLSVGMNPPLPVRLVNVSPSGTMPAGYIVLWQAQVAVNLQTPEMAAALQNPLGADCLSSMGPSGADVLPCAMGATGPKVFAVWNRLPSMASTTANSNFWYTNPTIRQFTQMYTVSPVFADPTLANGQYFVCGS